MKVAGRFSTNAVDAFTSVGGAPAAVMASDSRVSWVFERRAHRCGEQPLHRAVGLGRTGREGGGEGIGRRPPSSSSGTTVVTSPYSWRLGGRQRPVRQGQLHRSTEPDDPGEEVRRRAVGRETDRGVRHDELRRTPLRSPDRSMPPAPSRHRPRCRAPHAITGASRPVNKVMAECSGRVIARKCRSVCSASANDLTSPPAQNRFPAPESTTTRTSWRLGAHGPCEQAVGHREIDAVGGVGTIEGEPGDPIRDIEQHFGHGCAPYRWGAAAPASTDRPTYRALVGCGPMTEFFVFLPQMRMGLDVLLERARAAEAAGFDGLALMDHLAPPLALDQPMYEAMTTAAWLLARTDAESAIWCCATRSATRRCWPARRSRSTTRPGAGSSSGIGSGSVPEEFVTFGVAPTAREGADRSACRDARGDRARCGPVRSFDYQGSTTSSCEARQEPAARRGSRSSSAAPGRGRSSSWRSTPTGGTCRAPPRPVRRAARRRSGDARASIQQMVAFVADEAERERVTELTRRRFRHFGTVS